MEEFFNGGLPVTENGWGIRSAAQGTLTVGRNDNRSARPELERRRDPAERKTLTQLVVGWFAGNGTFGRGVETVLPRRLHRWWYRGRGQLACLSTTTAKINDDALTHDLRDGSEKLRSQGIHNIRGW
jgi:hypothetical protein